MRNLSAVATKSGPQHDEIHFLLKIPLGRRGASTAATTYCNEFNSFRLDIKNDNVFSIAAVHVTAL